MTDITTIGASAEWSRVESSVEPIAPPSSDDALFDAEILGDELMDIYNAAVVGGGDDDEGLNGMLKNTFDWHEFSIITLTSTNHLVNNFSSCYESLFWPQIFLRHPFFIRAY